MRTLKMQFTLDNEKVMQLSLANAKETLTADEVRTVMNQIVAKDIFLVGGAKVTAAKAAFVEVTNDEVLF